MEFYGCGFAVVVAERTSAEGEQETRRDVFCVLEETQYKPHVLCSIREKHDTKEATVPGNKSIFCPYQYHVTKGLFLIK